MVGESDDVDFDRDLEAVVVDFFRLGLTSLKLLGRGAAQSFSSTTRGRPVMEVRMHSIECKAHQVCAIPFFFSSGILAFSLRK